MIISLIMSRIESAKMPFFAKPIAKGIVAKVRGGYLDQNIQRHVDFMESTLQKSNWFCGDAFCAADVQMSYALEAAEVRADLGANYPALAACLKRMRERPAYKAALEKGGPYSILPNSQRRDAR
jgi:glutathione S-transferase